jgi:hypothetical protein
MLAGLASVRAEQEPEVSQGDVVEAPDEQQIGEEQGPSPTRQLQPPGFLAMNYGRRTPISVELAHLACGATLRRLYRHKV